MPRNFRYPSQPAQPGDALSIPVTGLSAAADAGRLSVSIDGLQVPVDEVSAVPGWAGVKRISITIPASAPTGDAVPIGLTESLPDGRIATSQSAIVARDQISAPAPAAWLTPQCCGRGRSARARVSKLKAGD